MALNIVSWFYHKFYRRTEPDLKLPPFDSIKSCHACGSASLSRTYDDGWFAGEKVDKPFMWVTCLQCRWRCGEQTLAQTQREQQPKDE